MNNFKSGRHQENMHRKVGFVSLPGVVIYLIVPRSLDLGTTGSIRSDAEHAAPVQTAMMRLRSSGVLICMKMET